MAAWIPAFLMRVKGMSLQEMAMYYGITSAVSFGFGLWFGGWIADRFARGSVQAYALVPGTCLLLTIPLVPLAVFADSWFASMLLWTLPVALAATFLAPAVTLRSEEHTSELQSLMRISYAVFCLKKKTKQN